MVFDTKNILVLCLLLAVPWLTIAQPLIKEKTEIAYGLTPQDSVKRFEKITQYDRAGRTTYKRYYYYHPREKGMLTKEETLLFDSTNNLLTEHIIVYPKGQEPIDKKMVTKYLVYAPKEKDSKHISRQMFDQYGEISREDTLTYNAQQQLLERCTYDYRGNTSLFCHRYKYSKAGLQSRWQGYTKWTTIDAKGEVAERQTKRRDYRYRYNKKGQLLSVRGINYGSRYRQKHKYDKNGKLAEACFFTRRKIRQASSKDKPAKKKYRYDKEQQVQNYQDGRLIRDVKSINKKETTRVELTYQDSLVKTYSVNLKGTVVEKIDYEYDNSQSLVKKIQKKYSQTGTLRYTTITTYNAQEKPIQEEQIMNGKTLSVLKLNYNKQGILAEQSLSTYNSQNFEKTTYIYKYY